MLDGRTEFVQYNFSIKIIAQGGASNFTSVTLNHTICDTRTDIRFNNETAEYVLYDFYMNDTTDPYSVMYPLGNFTTNDPYCPPIFYTTAMWYPEGLLDQEFSGIEVVYKNQLSPDGKNATKDSFWFEQTSYPELYWFYLKAATIGGAWNYIPIFKTVSEDCTSKPQVLYANANQDYFLFKKNQQSQLLLNNVTIMSMFSEEDDWRCRISHYTLEHTNGSAIRTTDSLYSFLQLASRKDLDINVQTNIPIPAQPTDVISFEFQITAHAKGGANVS